MGRVLAVPSLRTHYPSAFGFDFSPLGLIQQLHPPPMLRGLDKTLALLELSRVCKSASELSV